MRLTINGEMRDMTGAATVAELLASLELDARKIAIELNREIVPRSAYDATGLNEGDKIEIVHFIGGGNAPLTGAEDDYFEVAGQRFRSRLLVGTGKYKDFEETKLAIEASGAEIVTVAVRRVNVTDRNKPMLVDYVDPKNTPTCPTPPAASPQMTLCVPCASLVKPAAGSWSSSRCWATRRRSIPTWKPRWQPPGRW